MTFQLANRVRETNTITGTGNVTLGGSVSGYQTFAAIMANGDTTWYALVDNVANAWEVGLGTWNTGDTLSRTTVLASSNSGSLVSFAGNACDCFMDAPASAIGAGLAISVTAVTINAQLGSQPVPINSYLTGAVFRETAGHSVNVSLGTTSGASDVLPALTVPASGVLVVPVAAFAKGWFSASATQAVYVTSASWGSASINAQLTYRQAP